MQIELTLWDRSGTVLLANLDNAFDIQWQDALNEMGIGKFSLPLNDAAASLIQVGRLVRCNYHFTSFVGGPAGNYTYDQKMLSVFAWCIEEIVWNRVTTDEEMGQIIEVSGRDRGIRFDNAIVYPPKGINQLPVVETRSMSFASPEFNDTGWASAHMVAVYGDLNREWKDIIDGELQPAPFGWPSLPFNTYWIWSADTTQAGTCYFRQQFWLSSADQVTIIATGDNFWTLYLNGVALLGDNTYPSCWREHRRWRGDLDAGLHTLAAVVENVSTSPAGFLCAVYIEHPPDCDEEDPPNCTEVAPTVLVVSDGNWRCLAYPAAEPGFTPGSFIKQLHDEARARGQLLDIDLTFDSVKDSAGQDWEVMPEVGANIGDSILDVLDNLVNGYWIDWELSPYEYDADGNEIPGPPPIEPPPPPPPAFPPNVPSIIWYTRPETNFTLLIWDAVPDPAQATNFDVKYILADGTSGTLVTGQAEGQVGNAGGKSLPAGTYVPPHGGACWSQDLGAAQAILTVRGSWTIGGVTYTSEWAFWPDPK